MPSERELLEPFLADIDGGAPGLVVGFHLVGPPMMGDFRPGPSDLDFVAVLSRPAGTDDLAAIGRAHARYRAEPARPDLDGIWITGAELEAGPDGLAEGPTTRESRFHARAMGNRNPATWTMLADSAVSIRGQPHHLNTAWLDRARMKSWCCENAATEWTAWRRDAGRPWTARGHSMFGEDGPVRAVLGIGRLHHALETGRVVARSAVRPVTLARFGPRWRRLLDECERIRYGLDRPSLYPDALERRREALDFIDTVLATIARDFCSLAAPSNPRVAPPPERLRVTDSSTLRARLVDSRIAAPDDILGCTPEEIAALEARYGIFPDSYRDLLLTVGHAAGRLVDETEFSIYCDQLDAVNRSARETLAGWDDDEGPQPLEIPEPVLFICARRNDNHQFVRIGAMLDSSVFMIDTDRDRVIETHKSVWDWVEGFVRDAESFIAVGAPEQGARRGRGSQPASE